MPKFFKKRISYKLHIISIGQVYSKTDWEYSELVTEHLFVSISVEYADA